MSKQERAAARQTVVHNEDSVTSFNPVAFKLDEKVWDFFRDEFGTVVQINAPPKEKEGEAATEGHNNRLKVVFESGPYRYYTIDGRINTNAKIRNLRHGEETEVTFHVPASSLEEKDRIVKFMIFMNQELHTALTRINPKFEPKFFTKWQVTLVKKLSMENAMAILSGFTSLQEKVKVIEPKNGFGSLDEVTLNPFSFIQINPESSDYKCVAAMETEHSRIEAFLEDELGVNMITFLFQNMGKSKILLALDLLLVKGTAPEKTEEEIETPPAKIITKGLNRLRDNEVLANLAKGTPAVAEVQAEPAPAPADEDLITDDEDVVNAEEAPAAMASVVSQGAQL